MIDKEMITDLVFNNPLSLLVIKDKETIDYINSLIPYSSAFEIECDIINDTTRSYDNAITKLHNQIFLSIPDIMSVENDSYEQRYRIPNGLRGIICLFNISSQLKINSLLNPHSSVHYHVDCTDIYNTKFAHLVKTYSNWILSELDTWLNSPDEAVSRCEGSWYKINSLQTLEFRLGEMTFDYKILLKRIIHCNSIVKRFKDKLKALTPVYVELDAIKIINYLKTLDLDNSKQRQKVIQLQNKLNQLQNNKQPIVPNLPTEEAPIIRNRTHIFKPLK